MGVHLCFSEFPVLRPNLMPFEMFSLGVCLAIQLNGKLLKDKEERKERGGTEGKAQRSRRKR